MDSKDHPIVQRGIKAAELISEVSYQNTLLVQNNIILSLSKSTGKIT